MYGQIVIDCQTRSEIISCESRFVFREYQLNRGLEDKEKLIHIEMELESFPLLSPCNLNTISIPKK